MERSCVLNKMEDFRSQDKPRRLFLPVFEVVEEPDEFVELNEFYQFQIMTAFMKKFNERTRPQFLAHTADLIFLPVDYKNQQFLLTFDFRGRKVVMFDVKKHNKADINKTGRRLKRKPICIAARIAYLFGRHLSETGHVKGRLIENTKLELAEFNWQTTKYSKKHTGVVIMRCMEAYFGSDVKKWAIGLDDDMAKFTKQIEILRKKYAARIIFGEWNKLRDAIRKNVAKFKV